MGSSQSSHVARRVCITGSGLLRPLPVVTSDEHDVQVLGGAFNCGHLESRWYL